MNAKFYWMGIVGFIFTASFIMNDALEKKDHEYKNVTQHAIRLSKEVSDLKIELYRCKCEINPCPVIQ